MNVEMQKVLSKLDELISRRGFVYALIMTQIEDEAIAVDNLKRRNTQERLSSNEIVFLWSLLINKENIWNYPITVDELYYMRCEIPLLMDRLHFTFFTDVANSWTETIGAKPEEFKPYYDGSFFQEAIFYSGGDLYDEEYLYYTKKRYALDTLWLSENKGYNVESFCNLVSKIKETIERKLRRFRFLSLPETFEERLANKPKDLTVDEYRKALTFWQFHYNQDETLTLEEFCDRIREAISFTQEDLSGCLDINAYLKFFSVVPEKDCNVAYKEPGDYSILMSSPIIRSYDNQYLLTEMHQLFKSLYDVPAYWLKEEVENHKKFGTHVGDYSEEMTLNVLKGIFGDDCYSDIVISKGKKQITDIDVLCIWRDYALCFQIKSKGLTLSSRRGNFEAIRADFKKSFQSAFAQGVKCRNALLDKDEYTFTIKDSKEEITIPTLKEVYIICETSDEYPSLTHQMTVMLERKENEPEALAVNLFDVDLLSKYLNKPYYFVHYIHNRMKHYGSTRTDAETNCLSVYTYNRLYLNEGENDRFIFDNSFAKAIDAELLPQYAKKTEVKVDYSLWRDATFDALIEEMDSLGNNGVCDIIMKLMNFSGENK